MFQAALGGAHDAFIKGCEGQVTGGLGADGNFLP